jgi:pseudaminic acid cytidylyltransferase
MRTLAIIPARGGSKRIPHKNIRHFHGRPIIEYSIETALNSGLFDEVMVSTDDSNIASIAIQAGALVPFTRSAQTANDYASLSDVILEVLAEYTERKQEFDAFCCILPTAPLLSIKTLENGFEMLSQNYDAVCGIVAFSYPIQRALHLSNGNIKMIHAEHMFTRSQDLEETYHDSGQFYWCKTTTFLQNKRVFAEHTGAVILSSLQVQDIDNEDDWKIAELKYSLAHKK